MRRGSPPVHTRGRRGGSQAAHTDAPQSTKTTRAAACSRRERTCLRFNPPPPCVINTLSVMGGACVGLLARWPSRAGVLAGRTGVPQSASATPAAPVASVIPRSCAFPLQCVQRCRRVAQATTHRAPGAPRVCPIVREDGRAVIARMEPAISERDSRAVMTRMAPIKAGGDGRAVDARMEPAVRCGASGDT